MPTSKTPATAARKTAAKKAAAKKPAIKTAAPKKPAAKKASWAATAYKPVAGKAAAKPAVAATGSPSKQIDGRIAELGDWRGAMLSRVRQLILTTVPGVVEAWKWRGTPVWEKDGILCTGETYKQVVKLTFANGAALPDPTRLFNASLDGNQRRAIDIRETDTLDDVALKALVKAAVARNQARSTRK